MGFINGWISDKLNGCENDFVCLVWLFEGSFFEKKLSSKKFLVVSLFREILMNFSLLIILILIEDW